MGRIRIAARPTEDPPAVDTLADDDRRRARRPKPARRMIAEVAAPRHASLPWLLLFALVSFSALAIGWREVAGYHLTPKDGAGYWLGITGASMMASLLLYPARKHVKAFQNLGSVTAWFKTHLVLGIVGPVLIVIHSGFDMTSQNGRVAMIAMSLVVGSGVIGLYVYSRLHVGMYGRRAEVSELIKLVAAKEDTLGVECGASDDALAILRDLADETLADTKSLRGSWNFMRAASARRDIKRYIHTDLQASMSAEALHDRATSETLQERFDEAHAHVDSYFFTIEQIGSIRFYERLFAAWHLLHLPLFFVLIAAALVHIVAVHVY